MKEPSFKIVYQTNSNGEYVGETRAYESPLEPDVFLIPAGAVEKTPPTPGKNQIASWNGTDWTTKNVIIVTPTPTSTPTPTPTLTAPVLTWDTIRAQRSGELFTSDWTQLPDAPLSTEQKDLWTAYRQQLRNIPQIYSDPHQVVWPTLPS